MSRRQTMVQLTDEINEQLDTEAAQRGCSRSALIREAIVGHLDRTSLSRDISAYVDAYRRTPQRIPDT